MNFSDVLVLAAVVIVAVVVVSVMIHRRLRRIGRATGKMQSVLTGYGYVDSPANRERVTR